MFEQPPRHTVSHSSSPPESLPSESLPPESSPSEDLSPSRTRILLWGAAAIALFLRLWGLPFGMPGKYRPDEEYLVSTALGFLNPNTDYNPHFFIYPSLFFYLFGGVMMFCRWAANTFALLPHGFDAFVAEHGYAPAHLIGRGLSAFFGTIAILPVFQLTRRFGGSAAAVAASLLLATNYVHARESHFAVTDACCFFLSAMALAAVVRFSEEGRPLHLVLAALGIGLAISAKYPAASLGVPLALAHFNRFLQKPGLRSLGTQVALALFAAVLIIAAFAETSPYFFLDFETAKKNFAFQQSFVTGGLPGLEMELGWRWVFLFALPYGAGPGACVAALFGCIVGLIRSVRERRIHPALLLAALAAAQWTALSQSHLLFFRYILLSMLAIIPLAAWGIAELARCRNRLFAAASVLLFLWSTGEPLLRIIGTDRVMSAPDTRNAVLAWIKTHIEPGEAIAVHSSYYYGKPELPRGYRYVPFTSLERTGVPLPAPKWIIIDEHPITMFSPRLTEGQRAFLETRAEPVWHAAPAANLAGSSSLFDPSDAFYVPIAGFGGFTRAGTALTIYRVKEQPPAP